MIIYQENEMKQREREYYKGERENESEGRINIRAQGNEKNGGGKGGEESKEKKI